MIASRDANTLAVAAEAIGGETRFRATDLSLRGQAEALSDWAGEIDILVNNAGAIPGGDLFKVDEDTWRKAWDLKVFGYINLTRKVYAQMKECNAQARSSPAGVIINILGAAGERLNPAYIAGSSGNASLYAFTRALGGASHTDGVRVVGVSPGPVETDRLLSLNKQMAATKFGDAARYREFYKEMSFGRPASPEEIAWTTVFFASERSAYTTGCIVTIDGGMSSRWS
jgi:NAD(P)-dependent dehydrogenase (short-subunit alcohol dehydrogenase family)